MALGVPPLKSNLPVEDEFATWSQPWSSWLNEAWQILFASSESGTTAQRPTSNLWVGRIYMDVTLNRPIWYTDAGWRDATGTLV